MVLSVVHRHSTPSAWITFYQDPHTCNPKFHLHYGDLSDTSNLTRILREVQPDEVTTRAQ